MPKIKISLVTGLLKYWMQNGKTLSALIAGFFIVIMNMYGVDPATIPPEMLTVLSGIVAGVLHKIWKTIPTVITKD